MAGVADAEARDDARPEPVDSLLLPRMDPPQLRLLRPPETRQPRARTRVQTAAADQARRDPPKGRGRRRLKSARGLAEGLRTPAVKGAS